MNALSLFDGMSCGQIALKELGIKGIHINSALVSAQYHVNLETNYIPICQRKPVQLNRAAEFGKIIFPYFSQVQFKSNKT